MALLLRRFTLLLLPIAYMSFIWLQSSHFNPETAFSSLSSWISLPVIVVLGIGLELAHLFEFGILYLLMIMVFLSFGELSKWKEIIAVMIAFLYGFIDEMHQMYVPYRSASLGDLLKNTIGIFVAWWLIRRYYFQDRDSRVGRLLRRITQSSIAR